VSVQEMTDRSIPVVWRKDFYGHCWVVASVTGVHTLHMKPWLSLPGAALMASLLLSGCGSIGQSEAYQIGVDAGKEIKSIREQADVITSWFEESDDLFDDAAADPNSYCAAAWPLAGIANGMKNSSENKNDFIQGCIRGAR
jgi:hypothetical protein